MSHCIDIVWICQVRFFITVKKNYRAVAYHNWAHGFHVANSIYSILKASPGIFSPLEVRTRPGVFVWYSCSFSDSVWLCMLGQYVMIWTTGDLTISLWLILGHHWRPSTLHQLWKTITSTWPSTSYSRWEASWLAYWPRRLACAMRACMCHA